jgi:hypothetical protein
MAGGTIRFALCPLETVSLGGINYIGPKYFQWPFDPDPPALIPNDVVPKWWKIDYGLEPTTLIAANMDAAQITTLQGLSDVTLVPANMDNQIGANLAVVQAALEAKNIPADLIVATNTYRQVLRGVLAIFYVAQLFNGKEATSPGVGGRIFPAGITFNTTLGELSLRVRDMLRDAAMARGIDYSGLTLTSTLREVLRLVASQPVSRTLFGLTI